MYLYTDGWMDEWHCGVQERGFYLGGGVGINKVIITLFKILP